MREFEGWPPGIILVIGGRKSWLDWVKYCPPGREIFCIDRVTNISSSDPRFIQGDVLKLESLLKNDPRLKGKQIAGIYADFLLNAVGNEIGEEKIIAYDMIENPQLLNSEPFPIEVRRWFSETKQGKLDVAGGDLIRIRELIMECALEQMLEALTEGGKITVVDFFHRIDWVFANSLRIAKRIGTKVEIEEPPIGPADYSRSESLRNQTRDGDNIVKISLRKLRTSYPETPLGWSRSEDWS